MGVSKGPPLPSELTLWSDSACVFNFHCRVRGWQREAQNWFSPLSVTEPATTSAFVFCSLRPHLYSAWLQSRRQHLRSYSTAYSPIYTVSGRVVVVVVVVVIVVVVVAVVVVVVVVVVAAVAVVV